MLTALDAHVGEEKVRGQNLGQIDRDGGFKVTVQVDEFYLPRVRVGQRVTATFDGQTSALVVAKLYPQVKDGRFQIDLAWDGAPPPGLRRGQAAQGKLELGGDAPAVVLPAGPFLEASSGRLGVRGRSRWQRRNAAPDQAGPSDRRICRGAERAATGRARGDVGLYAASIVSTDSLSNSEEETAMTMLQLVNLTKRYRTSEVETLALRHVSLSIGQGEFVAIMGPSGCGKSTLLNILGLLDTPSQGQPFLPGRRSRPRLGTPADAAAPSPRRLRVPKLQLD